jgi:serine/threonine protein kinase
MIGDLIDHYRVLELVGRGAMGVVYKALDLNLDRPVAIKVMSAEARNDPDFVERFRQEARMQAALNHPNVALLFDYFVHDGAPVAVMEFIDGESLEQLIRRRGAIPAHESIPIFKQALRGVAAAHRAGIIHRDLKAANLMITRDDIVKVMDFGIAKRQGATGATKASTSIGSPLYMAPEQILGRPVDCRTDVYALGITLYQLLSGQPPFNPRGKTEYSVLNAHVNDLPEPPTVYCRNIPQPIVDAVMRSIAKEPDARFQSADDFMRALPDVCAPHAAAPPVDPGGTVATPRVGPTGTVTIPRLDATGTVATPRLDATGTVSLEYSPGATMVFEYASSTHREPEGSMAFDYSAGTLRQDLHPPVSVPSPAAAQGSRGAPPRLVQRRRAHRPVIAAVLVATLVLGTLVHRPQRLHASRGASAASTQTQTPTSTEPAAPPPAVATSAAEPAAAPSADVSAATVVPATRPTLATTTAPARQDLSGTWRGAYVDAAGKQLLRVVSLSISRVQDDGGIEGTLQYAAASGDGECQLHPRGSSYSAGEQRLQLSPEGCSARYPKELGVPLDFDGVNPRANTLRDGRIEAPTGEVISVKLQRVSGV